MQYPFPDFNINHQCRDFAAIKQWQNEHAVNEDDFVAYGSRMTTAQLMSCRIDSRGYMVISKRHEDAGGGGGEIG